MQYSIHILPDGSVEVVYGWYLAVVVVLHEYWQGDLAVGENGEHVGVHEAAGVPLGASTEHFGGCGRAVVVVRQLLAYYLTVLQ